MAYSELIGLCFANVSENERLVAHVHDPNLKAKYAESALDWRRLAEQLKNHYYPIGLPTPLLRHEQRHDAGQKQLVLSGTQIDARRNPVTGQWEYAAP
jgi:hypothetical protein